MRPAAAIVLRVAEDGTQTSESVVELDPASNQYVTKAIDLSSGTSEAFLVLFGTGVGDSAQVEATIGEEPADVTFAGPQGAFVGLDQVNVRIPRSLIGRGEVGVAIAANGQKSNRVTVRFASSE